MMPIYNHKYTPARVLSLEPKNHSFTFIKRNNLCAWHHGAVVVFSHLEELDERSGTVTCSVTLFTLATSREKQSHPLTVSHHSDNGPHASCSIGLHRKSTFHQGKGWQQTLAFRAMVYCFFTVFFECSFQ